MGNMSITLSDLEGENQLTMKEGTEVTSENALDLSIEKWETIVGWAEKGNHLIYLLIDGPGTCGLCRMYYADGCRDCPVALYSGNKHCNGTPLDDFDNSRDDGDDKKALEAAKSELAFLRRLKETN